MLLGKWVNILETGWSYLGERTEESGNADSWACKAAKQSIWVSLLSPKPHMFHGEMKQTEKWPDSSISARLTFLIPAGMRPITYRFWSHMALKKTNHQDRGHHWNEKDHVLMISQKTLALIRIFVYDLGKWISGKCGRGCQNNMAPPQQVWICHNIGHFPYMH